VVQALLSDSASLGVFTTGLMRHAPPVRKRLLYTFFWALVLAVKVRLSSTYYCCDCIARCLYKKSVVQPAQVRYAVCNADKLCMHCCNLQTCTLRMWCCE
jgi:hypothetical protein